MGITRLGRIFAVLLVLFGLIAVAQSSFATVNAGITYQGRIIKPDGTPLESSSVQFKIQIRTPNTSDCLMYEETRVVDMSSSNGIFAITINDGGGTRTDASGYTLPQVLGNHGTFSFTASTCGGTNTYTPNLTDGRKLSVSFNDSSGWEAMPNVAVNFAPSAIEAVQVGGFSSDTILRVQDASGVPSSVTPLSPANFTELLALINGTSTKYVASSGAGAVLPNLSSNSPTAAGDIWFDSTTHQVKYYDGTSTQIVGTSGGSVTSVATGTGLTGGPITTSGTISLASIGSANTTGAAKVTYDVYGRVTGSLSLAEADLPTITTAGKVSGDAITSGTIGGSTAVSTTGNLTAGNISGNNGAFKTIEIWKSDNSNKITLSAPTGLSTNYGLALPTTAGSANQLLQTDGTGNLSWVTPAAGSVTTVTGTAPISVATGTTTPAISISQATTSTNGYLSSTDWNTFNGKLSATTADASYFKNAGNSFAAAATLGTNDNFALSLKTNGTSRMTIDPAGNIGIGTSSPSWPLSVSGTDAMASLSVTGGLGHFAGVRFQVSGVDRYTAALGAGGAQVYSRFDNSGTYQNDPLILDSSGNVTLGGNQANSGSAGTPAIFAGATGNVGIGTVTPAYTLDVNGLARATQLCIGTDCRSVWPTSSSGGTVTSVTSANGDISVATGTSTPVLTLNSGTSAGKILKLDGSAKIPAVDGSQITNLNASNLASGTVAEARMPAFTGDVTTSAGATAATLAQIQGVPLTITTLASGNFLKYNGTAWVNVIPSSADLSDASGLIKSSQMPANCGASQTLTFSSPTGTWACSTISVSGVTGTLPVAQGGTGTTSGNITGTGALTFSAGGTNNNVIVNPSGSGNFSVGYSLPTSQLYVRSGTPGVSSGTVTVSGTAGVNTYTMSTTTGAPSITIGDYILPTTSTAQGRHITGISGTTITVDPGQPLSQNVTNETFAIYRPLITAFNNSTPKFTVQGYTGRVGVNTRYPSGAIDANINLPNQNNIALRGVISPAHTVSGSYVDMGFQLADTAKIAAGVTDSGFQIGVQSGMLRNYGTAGDSGTLSNQRALDVSYGHLNSDGTATPTTTNAYGMFMQPWAATGTISNMYDIYLAAAPTGATLTNGHYGIYQADSSVKSYFAGTIGIGNASPGYPLDVAGDINTTTCLRTSAGVASGTCSSDARLKTDVKSFDIGLTVLLGLQPKTFKYNGLGGQPASKQDELGVIAQDVERIAPTLVHGKEVILHPGDTEKTEIKTVNYSAFLYVVINSIKEFYGEFSESKRAIASLQEENAKLKVEAAAAARERDEIRARLDRIEQKLNAR